MSHDPEPAHVLHLPTLRELVTPIFRHRVAGLLTAVALSTITIAVVLRAPKEYESEMKILVKRERVDPIVSADRNVIPQGRSDVTEDELNSEVELLKSSDLLEEVAVASGLHRPTAPARAGRAERARDRAQLSQIVRGLQGSIKVTPLRRTTLIRISYRSPDPDRAARVLSQLARLYLEKHLTLHRPPGAYEFFTQQVERFEAELAKTEGRLKEYGRQENVVSAEIELASALQKLSDFEATLFQTRGAILDADRRIAELEAQISATPSRQTTQVRTSENAALIGQLKSRILDLEVRQADMLRKFTPTYPPVVEVGQQLAQARAALERTEQTPLKEETTDQNPTHQWLRSELARVRTERVASKARAATLADSVRQYREKARQLEEKGTAQQDLTRTMKSAEENYLLYRRKQEEARISDALDRTRIANVVVAEAPTVPALPSNSGRSSLLLLGTVMSVLMGIGITYVLHYISPYFRSPEEVERSLGIPVLTSFPAAR